MSARDEVIKAIEFQGPRYVPLWYINADMEKGDIANYWLFALGKGQTTEWGYQYEHAKEDNGTMGMPRHPVIADWDAYKKYTFPDPRSLKKYEGVDDFMRGNKSRYRVASMGISGFNTYLFLRGFDNAMVDFACKDAMAADLLEKIFHTETEIIKTTSKYAFDAVMFYDDWGMQKDIMVSPLMWRKIFRPLYEKQFKTIHDLGMHVFFHSCGDITAIIEDFHDIGVDVINIGQPNVIDIDRISHALKGKQCFLTPISYQTVSISGTVQDIKTEAKRLYEKLATKDGGMIGWVEEYSSIGMPRKNYLACAQAFKELKK
jgi:uroporphyrinogen decarboxylase